MELILKIIEQLILYINEFVLKFGDAIVVVLSASVVINYLYFRFLIPKLISKNMNKEVTNNYHPINLNFDDSLNKKQISLGASIRLSNKIEKLDNDIFIIKYNIFKNITIKNKKMQSLAKIFDLMLIAENLFKLIALLTPFFDKSSFIFFIPLSIYYIILKLIYIKKNFIPKNITILRTFGDSNRSSSLLTSITGKWKYMGNRFLIGDVKLVELMFEDDRYKDKLFENMKFEFLYGNVWGWIKEKSIFSMIVIVLIVSSIVFIDPESNHDYKIILYVLFVFGIYLTAKFYYIRNRLIGLFEKSKIRIDEILNRKNLGRNYLLIYKVFSLFCYGDIWKSAVDKITGISDLTIMDLRGFTREKRGCEYEIQFLLRNIDTQKLLFLISDTTDYDFFLETIKNANKNTTDHKKYIRVYFLNKAAGADSDNVFNLMVNMCKKGKS